MKLSQLQTERQWSSAIGMQKAHFEALLNWFEVAYHDIYGVGLNQACKNLKQPFVFEHYADLLFFVLVKIKHATTNDMISLMFGLAPATAQYNYQKGVALLERALQLAGQLPKRKFKDTAEFLSYVRNSDVLLIDVTELAVERPLNKEQQGEVYSGKKTTHL